MRGECRLQRYDYFGSGYNIVTYIYKMFYQQQLFAAQGFDGQGVALQTESADHAPAGGTDEGMVAVVLACEDVGQMDLDGWGGDGKQGVAQGYRGVAVATAVDNDAVSGEAYLLYAVDEFTFNVALVVAQLDVGEPLAETRYPFVHALGAIVLGFAYAGKVQVGAVDDLYPFHCRCVLGGCFSDCKSTQKFLFGKIFVACRCPAERYKKSGSEFGTAFLV